MERLKFWSNVSNIGAGVIYAVDFCIRHFFVLLAAGLLWLALAMTAPDEVAVPERRELVGERDKK